MQAERIIFRILLKHFLLFCAFFIPFSGQVFAQKSLSVSGTVMDARTREALPGASVFPKENPGAGKLTSASGHYSLKLPSGNYTLLIQYLGYKNQEIQLNLSHSQTLDFLLEPGSVNVAEVEVTAKRSTENLRNPQMGEVILPMEQIKTLPVIFGETDILKTIQLLPGVKSGGEGNTGFYVRGGGADQNLVLLDDATIYNPGHLLNFFSVFNSDVIENTTLIKGDLPARYGGRLSSVLDITTRNGNPKKISASGGLGIISSRLLLEGPLVKEKIGFQISGRRTYIDKVAEPFLKNTDQGGVPFYFYDLNGRMNFNLSPKDRLFISGYFGRDVGEFSLSGGTFKAKFDWGNAAGTANWKHSFSDKLLLNVSAIRSSYKFNFTSEFDAYTAKLLTAVKDNNLKADLDWQPSSRHFWQFGGQLIHHTLTPRSGQAQTTDGLDLATTRVQEKYAYEAGIYASENFSITEDLEISAGFRASFFRQLGPFTQFSYNANGAVTDSVKFGPEQKVRDFFTPEPRVSVRYSLSSQASVKAGFSRNAQYLHLVSNSFTSLPLDIWVPASALVEPQKSTQYSAGFFRNFLENTYEASAEIYYKSLQNQLEYRDGYVPGPSNRDLEYEFVSGNGKAYGVELFLRKNSGKLQGWLGYTLSYAYRQFPELNKGQQFPARFDRRHDGSAVAAYSLNENWKLGAAFVYGTGQPLTIPERRYLVEGKVLYQYGDRNGFRMQAFHRLDLSATYHKPQTKRFQSSWTFAVYNVYARQNPFFYYIESTGNVSENSVKLQAKKVSIFPFPVPSVTWNFTF